MNLKSKAQSPMSKVIEAIRTQQQTLRRSYRGIDGRITDRRVEEEIGLLQEAIGIVRATLVKSKVAKRPRARLGPRRGTGNAFRDAMLRNRGITTNQ